MPKLYMPVYLIITEYFILILHGQVYGNEATLHDTVHHFYWIVRPKIEIKVTFMKVKNGETTIWLPEQWK